MVNGDWLETMQVTVFSPQKLFDLQSNCKQKEYLIIFTKKIQIY